MSRKIIDRFVRDVPYGWRQVLIGDVLQEVSEPILMHDSDLYKLVSIRRRNGGMFLRDQLRGRQILTKDLQRIVPGTFVIARRQIIHGASALATEEFADAAVSSSYSLFAGREGCVTKFFAWLASHPLMYAYFLDASHGVVIEKMNFDVDRWLSYPINLPPVREQWRIVEILDTADEVIRSTKRLIAKLEQARLGLRNDLLTHGIDDKGRVRDPRTRSEHFEMTANGFPPSDWNIASLVDLVSLPSGQVDPRILPYSEMVLIAPDHVASRNGELLARVTARQQHAISGKYLFEPGDVIYSKIRPYLRKAVVAYETGICSADMYPLRPSPMLNPGYLLAVLLGDDFSRFAESISMRTGIPKLNREELEEYQLVVPTRAEQDRIVRVMDAIDSMLKEERRSLEKLCTIKRGLMSDLLTGRVRVSVETAS